MRKHTYFSIFFLHGTRFICNGPPDKCHGLWYPYTAQLARQPKPQYDYSWRIRAGFTLYCCYQAQVCCKLRKILEGALHIKFLPCIFWTFLTYLCSRGSERETLWLEDLAGQKKTFWLTVFLFLCLFLE